MLDLSLLKLYDEPNNRIVQTQGRHRRVLEHPPAANPANWQRQLTRLVSLYHKRLWLLKDIQTAASACVVEAAVLFVTRRLRAGCETDTLPGLVHE